MSFPVSSRVNGPLAVDLSLLDSSPDNSSGLEEEWQPNREPVPALSPRFSPSVSPSSAGGPTRGSRGGRPNARPVAGPQAVEARETRVSPAAARVGVAAAPPAASTVTRKHNTRQPRRQQPDLSPQPQPQPDPRQAQPVLPLEVCSSLTTDLPLRAPVTAITANTPTPTTLFAAAYSSLGSPGPHPNNALPMGPVGDVGGSSRCNGSCCFQGRNSATN